MNYLAHVFLARRSPDAMVGALLGDFVRAGFPGRFAGGVEREIFVHRKVDSFTDGHELILAAKRRFPNGTRRYAGILLDLFFDHVLAANWGRYCEVPFGDFVDGFYRDLAQFDGPTPERFDWVVARMISQDWLRSYRQFSGVELAIRRFSTRLKRNEAQFTRGVDDLRTHYDFFSRVFAEFFPQLVDYADAQRRALA